jgi:Membrane protein implicated in regulation of membrane protease activity
MFSEWWVWGSAAILLAIGEVLLPGYILLGFAMGAAGIAVLLLIGGPLAFWVGGSVPATLFVFAALSLAAWLGLRRWLGVTRGQVKTFDRDINED